MRAEERLFEAELVEKKRLQARATGVGKRFRAAFDPHQVLLLPPSLDDWLTHRASRPGHRLPPGRLPTRQDPECRLITDAPPCCLPVTETRS